MPYRPDIHGGFEPGEKPCTYRLGGPSCLAGDIIGDWSFERPLGPGDRLAFLDMAHYTMVKTTTFNGIRHPHICTFEPATGELKVVRSFGYEDFKNRLA
jgi:carboxynorspermidine decarboxylase